MRATVPERVRDLRETREPLQPADLPLPGPEAGEILLSPDYPRHPRLEKEFKRVANTARRDVREFLEPAARIPIRPEAQEFPFEEAKRPLRELEQSKFRGDRVPRIV